MKVYIYKPDKSGFQDDWLFAVDVGFKQLGAKIIYFDDINSIPYAPDNIVVAYVEDTRDYFDLHRVDYPIPLNIPAELKPFRYRLGKKMTFGDAAALPSSRIFIKPVIKVKQFPGGVINVSNLRSLIDISDDELVYVGEVVEMLSEYRCFVYEGQLVGMKHYQGDYTLFPKMENIQEMIKSYSKAPIAYSLDVAIQRHSLHGTVTSVVECNDFWSVGHYGLDPLIYAKMLRDRWFQLTKYKQF